MIQLKMIMKGFNMNDIIYKLREIFDNNKEKRICVLGTTCTGKTTFINEMNVGQDMDEMIFPLLSEEEKEYVCTTPWTEEIGKKMDELVQERIRIIKGIPVFGTVLLDCDLIVYLDICDELLLKRTKLRDVDFNNAKNMKLKIEKEISKSNIECISLRID